MASHYSVSFIVGEIAFCEGLLMITELHFGVIGWGYWGPKMAAYVHTDPMVSYRYGAITIPHIDWIEPLRLECEDFANSIRLWTRPRAHGGVGVEVVQVLAVAQEVLEKQELRNITVMI